MNILYICNEYPPGKSGGIGSATRNLAEEMVKKGHGVFVAGLYWPGYGQQDREEINGVEIWRKRLSIDKGIIRNNYSILDTVVLSLFRRSGLLYRSFKKGMVDFISFLEQLVINHNIDIIEWPDYNECFGYKIPVILPADFPAPVVVKFHGTDSYIRQQTKRIFDRAKHDLEKKHILAASSLIAVSDHTAKQYASFYQLDREIPVLYNCVKVSGDEPAIKAGDKKIVVFAGSLNKFKGVYSLLNAWNLVSKIYPRAVLQIFGKGNPKKFINILEADVKRTVVFMGFTDPMVVKQAFADASMAVFPSYTECFSLAPLEAMSVGCPVLYTERASGPELICEGENGLLIDPDNIPLIAESIVRLMAKKELRTRFSENGKRTVTTKFNIANSADLHLTLYQNVIKKHKREK